MTRLIQTIDTSLFSPPSPDPAGITFLDDVNRLLISDTEVEETDLFAGVNLYTTDFDGSVINSGSTLTFSAEPTGLTYDSASGSLFISDDDSRRIYEVTVGSDGIFGTADDSLINEFNTRPFGSGDPEDVAFHPDLGTLFIADGKDDEIYEVNTNGTLIDSFETDDFGLCDPEGIGLNPESGNFFIIGEPANQLYEFTVDGDLVQRIDISNANPVQPAGVTFAPSSDNAANRSLYIVDRAIDESVDPDENDGKVYEFALEETIYATVRDTVILNGESFDDEDVIAYDSRTGTWSQYLDGSDIGLTSNDIDAVHVNNDGSVLLSLNRDTSITGIGSVDDADILRFVPTSTGTNTAGNLELYFDGSDVGLNSNTEDIDGISVSSNGDILLSTNGSYRIANLNNFPRLSGNDEDILAFSPSSLGGSTSGSFSLYVDGSDINLNNSSSEDIKGLSILDDGELVLSTLANFQVEEVIGNGSDLFSFSPDSLGNNTSGTFNLFSEGAANGFGNQVIADFSIV